MDERKRKRLERRWQRLIKNLCAFAEESGIPEPMLVMGYESGIYAYPRRLFGLALDIREPACDRRRRDDENNQKRTYLNPTADGFIFWASVVAIVWICAHYGVC